MTIHDPRPYLSRAYPGLLPSFFTPMAETPATTTHAFRVRLAFRDPSIIMPERRRRRLERDFAWAALRALSLILDRADAVTAGDAVILTCALPAEVFDDLCACGAEFEDIEPDDPAEEDDPGEDGDADEDDHRDNPMPTHKEVLQWA